MRMGSRSEPMPILGYCDRPSAAPGECIRFMVSCTDTGSYRADIVRLIHGDLSPEGPGFKQEVMRTPVSGEYPARQQETRAGSCAVIPDHELLRGRQGFTLQALIWPTTPAKGLQGIMTRWCVASGAGYGLFIGEDASLTLMVGDGRGQVEQLSTGKPLQERCWYFVAATWDAGSGQIRLYQEPMVGPANGRFASKFGLDETTAVMERGASLRPTSAEGIPFVIAGAAARAGSDLVQHHFNGKIDRPRVATRPLTRGEMALWVETPSDPHLAAAWDVAASIGPAGVQSPRIILDRSPNALHGITVNLPTRGVTGYNWSGREFHFVRTPEQYGAIHFHDDDLEDARWEADFALTIPDDMPSGVYAAHVRTTEAEDYIPFFVRPRTGEPTARVGLLIPTYSYLAYANDNNAMNADLLQLILGHAPIIKEQDMHRYIHRELGGSLYDTHTDGSGVCYSSWLRPLLNIRPKYRHTGARVWQFNADLHLTDWLAAMDIAFDVFTDHDLHRDGADLLKPYEVVLTGTHPEYCSERMLDALQEYGDSGGRLMYLGGNGFYWVTSPDPENPNVVEVRRWGGTEAWTAQPGEQYLSFTGEMGGIWRNRGRAPQKVFGVGFIAQGLDVSTYYRRRPDSFDSRVAWIFDGIGEDERIGNFGLAGGGAAGLELDCYDPALGSPPGAFLLASSEGHSDTMLEVRENLGMTMPALGGMQNPRVRADLVYFPTPSGGAVFSTGSIAWCGSLSHNGYDNNVSRITRNVLLRFLSGEPLS